MTFYPPTSYQIGNADGTAPDEELSLKWVYPLSILYARGGGRGV